MSKILHYNVDQRGNIACGAYGTIYLESTKRVDDVTCKSCKKTIAFNLACGKHIDKINTYKYKLFYGDKVMITGTIDQIKEWLNLEALHQADKYKLVKITDNTYTLDWELKLTKDE